MLFRSFLGVITVTAEFGGLVGLLLARVLGAVRVGRGKIGRVVIVVGATVGALIGLRAGVATWAEISGMFELYDKLRG